MNWRGREEERCSVSNRSRSGRGGARRGWRRARGQSVGEEEDGELGEGRRRPWGRAAVTSGKGGGDGGARRRRGGRQTQLGEGRWRWNRAGTGGADGGAPRARGGRRPRRRSARERSMGTGSAGSGDVSGVREEDGGGNGGGVKKFNSLPASSRKTNHQNLEIFPSPPRYLIYGATLVGAVDFIHRSYYRV